jgi:hypothetical protein
MQAVIGGRVTQSFVLEQKSMQQFRAAIAVSEERNGKSHIQGT